MRKTIVKLTLATTLGVALGLTGLHSNQDAKAQSITIGGNDRQIAQALSRQGYTDIVVVRRGFTITNFEACRGGEKFRIKVNVLGQIKSTDKVGTCGKRFAAKDAVTAMQNAGYSSIDAKPRGDQVVAVGCLENRKYELTFNLRGDVINRSRQGRCRADALRPRQVRAGLRDLGYDRIRFTDRELPRYVAEACNDRSRVELVINRRGQITSERKLGSCPGPINPNNIAAVLRNQGYSRVEAVQIRRAPYMVRACKGAERQELIVSRYGEAMSNTNIGKCARPLRPGDVAAAVTDLGYSKVKVLRGNRTPYLVEACKGQILVELTLSRFGEVNKEERVGSCGKPMNASAARVALSKAGHFIVDLKRRQNGSWDANTCKDGRQLAIRINRFGDIARGQDKGECGEPTIFNAVRDLEARGASATNFFVEGCFKKRNYRWTFNRLGIRINRKTLPGTC